MNNNPQNQDSLEEELKAAFESNSSDKNYNMGKGIVNFLPAGPLVGAFFESYIVSPAMKRSHKFFESLVREIRKLESKIELVDFESPAFETTMIHVYQIVIRTHQEQKLEALRNIVLNSSIPTSIEDDVLAMFLNWTDYFSELHISTLRHLHYLDKYDPEHLCTYFPMLEEKRDTYNQILKDLAYRGLITLKEKFIAEEDDDDLVLQSLGIPMPQIPVNSIYNQFKKKGEKEVKMKIFRHQEDIDKILKNNRSSSQVSKTTKLGKQFIKFIEYPSIQTESL